MATVVEHLLDRLKEIGVTDVFGVPGDYSFSVSDAISNDVDMRWIGCSNELNAAFAADGYARIKGTAAVCTTYGVGELSAINAIAGAYAEFLPVFHIVGMPKDSVQRKGGIMHHTLGNGEFDLFYKMTQPVVCASTILTPENAMAETDRVINAALINRQPVYIGVPADFAHMDLGCAGLNPVSEPKSDPEALDVVVDIVTRRINEAELPVAIVGAQVGRYGLRGVVQDLIEKAGLPFTSMFMGKGTLSEAHPSFIGVYNGRILAPEVRDFVEQGDLVLSIGAIMSDINTGAFSTNINPSREVRIMPDRVIVGRATYHDVYIEDVLERLVESVAVQSREVDWCVNGLGDPVGEPDDDIEPAYLYPRLEQFFQPGDIIMGETGTASMGLVTAKLPEDALFFNQTLWGSIGWATPASFGAAMARPESRSILITGEGAHQMTVQEIGQFGRFGLKPIIICLNNDGYLIERLLCEDPYIDYNDLAQWNYARLPEAFGMEDWYTARVTTNGQLDVALRKAAEVDTGVYIEVVTAMMAASEMALALNRIVVGGGGWKE